MIDLAGTWELRDVDGEFAVPMAIPGDAISALHDAGVSAACVIGRVDEAADDGIFLEFA